MPIVRQTKHAEIKSVLIHALDCVVEMLTAMSEITFLYVFVSKAILGIHFPVAIVRQVSLVRRNLLKLSEYF